MKLHRTYAIFLRYMYLFRRSLDRSSDIFYWVTIDLLLWGLTSSYFQKMIGDSTPYVLITISGLILWLVLWRAQYEITVNLLEDLWNKNLVNIFVSPLTFYEWISAFVLIGIGKTILGFIYATIIAYLIYGVNVLILGLYILPLVMLLLMSGWFIGFIVAGFILRYGTKIQTFAWTVPYIVSPFSAVFFPLSTLPNWAQKIALLVPSSYVFEAMRELLLKKTINMEMLLISFVINSIYLLLSIYFLKRSFQKVLDKGLVKVY